MDDRDDDMKFYIIIFLLILFRWLGVYDVRHAAYETRQEVRRVAAEACR